MPEERETGGIEPVAPSAADEQPAVPTQETAAASETDQPTPAESEPTEAEPATPDPWESLKDDPRVIARIAEEAQKKADALAQKRLAAERKRARQQKAASAVETQDADAALEVAAEVRDEPIEEMPWLHPEYQQRLAEAQRAVASFANTPAYAAVYAKFGAETMNGRFAQDPQRYVAWVQHEMTEWRIDAEAEKRAKVRAEALATDKANRALKNVPVPPGLNGAGPSNDQDFLLAYGRGENDDHARARRLLAAQR